MNTKTLLLGGHLPRFNGLEDDIKRGEKLGFSVIQIYIRNDQSYVKHEIQNEAINSFRKALEQSSIKYVIALDPFMKQLGLSELKRPEIMNELIADELSLCDLLGIPYLIIHPGTCNLRKGTLECITDIADNLSDILIKSSNSNTMLLVQNMASGGRSICYSFEHMAQLYRDCTEKIRVGFCFDMCAAFASGYSFETAADYEAMWKEFDRVVGLPHLKAIHINDSTEDKGSEVISHAYIGKGRIPFEAYRLIMNDKRFVDIPKIMEVPIQNTDEYKHTMDLLIDMLTPANKQLYGIK